MKNKIIKITAMLLVIVNLICVNYSYAGDLLIKDSDNTTIMQGDPQITQMASPIYTVAKYITYAAAVIIVIYKGLQFMNSATDPKESAKIKKELIAVTIGAVLIFAIGEVVTLVGKSAWSAVTL